MTNSKVQKVNITGVTSAKWQNRNCRPSLPHRETELTTIYGPTYFYENFYNPIKKLQFPR